MKRLLSILVVIALAIPALAVQHSGAMNIDDPSATISREGVGAVERIAKINPALRVKIEQTIECPLTDGDLEILQKVLLPKGRYLNSGTSRKRTPFDCYSVAKGGELCYLLRSRHSQKTVLVKNNCLNPIQQRTKAIPFKPTVIETTWDVTEIDVDINIVNNVSATATASTAPINITFNNITAGSPMMVMAQPSPFMFVHDSRGLLCLGYTIGGTTKIINNVSATGGNSNVCNTNNNSNSNSNSNANTTVVNTGSGSAAGSSGSSAGSNSKAGGG